MRNFTRLILSVAAVASAAICADAQERTDLLWIAGEATPWGWSLDDASCIAATAEDPTIYTGTLYLEADKDFKFLTTFDWGNTELRPVVSCKPDADGKVKLTSISGDDNDFKIQVSESANYLITVNTATMEATFAKSEYQATHINFATIFMTGDATSGGWSIDAGTVMRQNPQIPYAFAATDTELNVGSFKIFYIMKGARSFDSKYFYFRDANDNGKMVLNSSEDNKWNISEAGKYDISANTEALLISIAPAQAGIDDIRADEAPATYYNMQGIRVSNPSAGQLLIKVQGNKSSKIRF